MSSNRPAVVAANWKMYKTDDDVKPYFEAFWSAAAASDDNRVIAFFPPFTLIGKVAATVDRRALVGGQNCHWEAEGACTGEISAPMIASAGAELVLVGHSERRHDFGEDDEVIGKKLRAVLACGLSPMLCVGETIEQRDAGQARSVVLQQLSRGLDGLSRDEYKRIYVAYEPVWAIGTGRTAQPDDAQEMHAAIREILGSIATPELAESMPVLYGGSVKPENAAALLAMSEIDGALVGGASLDPHSFAAIASAGG